MEEGGVEAGLFSGPAIRQRATSPDHPTPSTRKYQLQSIQLLHRLESSWTGQRAGCSGKLLQKLLASAHVGPDPRSCYTVGAFEPPLPVEAGLASLLPSSITRTGVRISGVQTWGSQPEATPSVKRKEPRKVLAFAMQDVTVRYPGSQPFFCLTARKSDQWPWPSVIYMNGGKRRCHPPQRHPFRTTNPMINDNNCVSPTRIKEYSNLKKELLKDSKGACISVRSQGTTISGNACIQL